VLITSLRSGGPSDDAKPKLLEDDILLAVDGRPLKTTDDLAAVTQELTKDQGEPSPVVVTFERKALQCMTVVKVGKEKPSEPGHEVRKAWLPVEVQVLTGELAEALHLDKTGVRITQVYPHSSAEKAGLAVGDFIVAIDGTPIPASRPEHFDVFPAMLRQYPVGTEVTLSVIRGTEERTLKVKLERSPTPAQELAKYEDDRFEFTVRDVSETDRAEERWPQAQQGAYVVSVSEGSWAALGHLAVGDLILHVQGEATASADDLKKAMEKVASAKPDTVVLHVQRGIHDLYLELRPKWQEAG
jgi:serine protease Do